MFFAAIFVLFISVQLVLGSESWSSAPGVTHQTPFYQYYTDSCLPVQKGKPFVFNIQPPYKQNIGDPCFYQQSECNVNYKYRYPDGRCNNIKYRSWGTTNHTISRLQPAAYSTNPHDPSGSQRVSAADNVSPLVSARVISNELFPDIWSNSQQFTIALMTLSQFMTHDVLNRKVRNPPPNGCCRNGTMQIPQKLWNPGCLAINYPEDDPFYGPLGQKCLSLPRGQFSSDIGCKLYEIEQMNDVNSYVDASVVYGNSEEIARSLRTGRGGKLQFRLTPDGRMFLPRLDQPNPLCFNSDKTTCFKSSDFRANQNIQLMAIQVAFLRTHNKLCDELKTINSGNPEWQNDEKLYQEAKRIVSAILQHITFGRISEIIFGNECSRRYGFSEPNGPGYFSGYDPELNAQTTAEFQNVAFRTFHGLTEGNIILYNDDREVVGQIDLSDWYNNPAFLMEPGNYDKLLLNLVTQPVRNFNRFYPTAITNKFFKQLNNDKFGADLGAIDVIRGRDFGMQPYIYYATLAGFPVAKDFQDLADRFNPKLIEQLRKLYKSVADIDAITGVFLEEPFGNSLVGKTLHHVIAEQFRRYKFGDSFFYSFEGRGQFTPGQLATIRSSSLAFIICYGSDNIQHIQNDAFSLPKGPLEKCSTVVNNFLKQLRANW